MGPSASAIAPKQKRHQLFSLFSKTKDSVDRTIHQRPEITSPVTAMPTTLLFMAKKKMDSRQEDADDDNIPLARMMQQQRRRAHAFPLPINTAAAADDDDDDDDMDLIPIAAALSPRLDSGQQQQYKSAADKYKEKVKERLAMNNSVHPSNRTNQHDDGSDDDNIPIICLLPRAVVQ